MALSLATVGGKVSASIFNGVEGAATQIGFNGVLPSSAPVVGSGTVTMSPLGTVTFTLASSVSVNNCFTALYANYLIYLNIPTVSTANLPQIRLRVGGVDDVSANYDTQVLSASSTTASAVQNLAASNVPLNGVNANIHDSKIDVIAPFLSQPTRFVIDTSSTANPMTAATGAVQRRAGLFRNTTSFDGFSIVASAGTMTGTVRVYGYNNG